MIPQRVKQFYINVTDKMSKSDIEYVKSNLSDVEFELFNKLLKSEQKHSVRIAKEIENLIDNNIIENNEIKNKKHKLIKIAILHDIGKIRVKLNVIDKSIIVILNKITKGKLKNVTISKKVQCYYNHGEYSYEILKDILFDKEILEVIRYHHVNNKNLIIRFLKEVDDRN